MDPTQLDAFFNTLPLNFILGIASSLAAEIIKGGVLFLTSKPTNHFNKAVENTIENYEGEIELLKEYFESFSKDDNVIEETNKYLKTNEEINLNIFAKSFIEAGFYCEIKTEEKACEVIDFFLKELLKEILSDPETSNLIIHSILTSNLNKVINLSAETQRICYTILTTLGKEIIDIKNSIKEFRDNYDSSNIKTQDGLNQILNQLSGFSNTDLEIEYEQQLLKAPSIDSSFIDRIKKIETLKNYLKEKNYSFIFGISRSSKSTLISQFLKFYNIDEYYWYDFKYDEKYESFLLNLLMFLSKILQNKSILKLWKGRQTNKLIIGNILKKINIENEKYFVLDNIHLSKEIIEICNLFNISNGSNFLKVVYISEEKDTLNSIRDLKNDYSVLEVNGFDNDEIKELFEKNNIAKDVINDNIIDTIKYQSMGHPDIINALIEEIKKSSKPNIIEILNYILGSLKLDNTNKLTKDIANKIYNGILINDDEKVFFNRLCALVTGFKKELAEKIAQIEPIISNSGLILNKLSIKLFDVDRTNYYSIPKLYKDIGESLLTQKEKENIWYISAKHLFKIEKNVLNFDDAINSCFYYLLSNKQEELLEKLSFILTIFLSSYKKSSKDKHIIFKSLKRLEIFLLNDKIDNSLQEKYFGLKVLYVHAYDLFKNDITFPDAKRFLSNVDYDSFNSVFSIYNLIFLYIHFCKYENTSNEAIDCLKKISFIINRNYELLKDKGLTNTINKLFGFPLYNVVTYKVPNLEFVSAIVTEYKKMDLDFVKIFPQKTFKEFLDTVFNVLLILRREKEYDVVENIEDIISKLRSIMGIFKNSNHEKGTREISYLIGCIITEFSDTPIDSVNYYNEAIKLNKIEYSDYHEFNSNCLIGIADSYFNIKEYNDSLTYYIKARKVLKYLTLYKYLYLHTYKRIGIILTYFEKNKFAKRYFQKSISIAYKLQENYLINLIESYGDYSTFLILNGDYKSAAKCFSIMAKLIHRYKMFDYIMVTGHCQGWLLHSLDEDWDGKLYGSVEEWTMPYFGIYSKKLKFDEFQKTNLSIATLLFSLGRLFHKLNLERNALNTYEDIVSTNIQSDLDSVTKILTHMELQKYYKNYKYYKRAINSVFQTIILYEKLSGNEINFGITKVPVKFPPLEYSENLFNHELIPIINENFKKYDSVLDFNKSRDIFKYIIQKAEECKMIYKKNLISAGNMFLGFLYLFNEHLEDEIKRTTIIWTPDSDIKFKTEGMRLVQLSERIAKDINFYYVQIQSRLIYQFNYFKSFHNLQKYLQNNSEILYYIMQDLEKYSYMINVYYDNFVFTWNNINIFKPFSSPEIIELLQSVKLNIDKFSKLLKSDYDKIIFFVLIFAKHIDENQVIYISLLKSIEFCLTEMDSRFSEHFGLIFEKYKESIEYLISVNSSNPKFIIETAKNSLKSIEKFENKLSIFMDIELKKEINEFKKYLNVFTERKREI